MIDSGDAFAYNEPETPVISRSGDTCVSGMTDQWYIRYGDEKWKDDVRKYISSEEFETYSPKLEKDFLETVEWLRDWGCSRSFGMGTAIPFDQKYIIESLSDSTIYMAYYTVAHYFQSDIFGRTPGIFNIQASEVTDEMLDYIFCVTDSNFTCEDPKLLKCVNSARDEFRYWYPFDLRVSAKGLIKNHLTMCLYNHVAMFCSKYYPRGMFVNGFVKINNRKMAKSTGNFKLMSTGIREYSADALRVALGDAGDSQSDANFDESVAAKNSRRIFKFISWVEEMYEAKKLESLRSVDDGKKVSEEVAFADEYVNAMISEFTNRTIQGYERMRYRDVVKFGWYEMLNLLKFYRFTVADSEHGFRRDIIIRFVETMIKLMAPVIPHTAEHIFQNIVSKEFEEKISIFDTPFPSVQKVDGKMAAVSRFGRYYRLVFHRFHQRRERQILKMQQDEQDETKKKKKISSCVVYVSRDFSEVEKKALGVMEKIFSDAGEKNPEKVFDNMGKIAGMINREVQGKEQKKKKKKKKKKERKETPGQRMMKFVSSKIREIREYKEEKDPVTDEEGKDLWVYKVLRSKCGVDEVEFWDTQFVTNRLVSEVMKNQSHKFTVKVKEEQKEEEIQRDKEIWDSCRPGVPQIDFSFED